MTIRKLPSGNWNTQIMIKGKSHSITAPTKTEVRDKVAALIEREKNREENGCTVLEAITQYIDSKRNILSPSTIYSYQQIADFRLGSIRDIPVGKLTSLQIQQAINEESVKLTPKGTDSLPFPTLPTEAEETAQLPITMLTNLGRLKLESRDSSAPVL